MRNQLGEGAARPAMPTGLEQPSEPGSIADCRPAVAGDGDARPSYGGLQQEVNGERSSASLGR
eukprot:12827768-Alexandrium_andersonii.AAC.1